MPIHFALYPPAHVDVPFDAAIKGSVAAASFRVVDTQLYQVKLRFYYKPNDAADFQRVLALVGMALNQNSVPAALAMPVKVRVARDAPGHQVMVVDDVVREEICEATGPEYASTIVTTVRLEPGSYHLTIEALENHGEIGSNPIHVEMAMWGPK